MYIDVQIQWRCRPIRKEAMVTKILNWYVGKRETFRQVMGSMKAMLSVLELIFLAMIRLSHINTQSMERIHTHLITAPF